MWPHQKERRVEQASDCWSTWPRSSPLSSQGVSAARRCCNRTQLFLTAGRIPISSARLCRSLWMLTSVLSPASYSNLCTKSPILLSLRSVSEPVRSLASPVSERTDASCLPGYHRPDVHPAFVLKVKGSFDLGNTRLLDLERNLKHRYSVSGKSMFVSSAVI